MENIPAWIDSILPYVQRVNSWMMHLMPYLVTLYFIYVIVYRLRRYYQRQFLLQDGVEVVGKITKIGFNEISDILFYNYTDISGQCHTNYTSHFDRNYAVGDAFPVVYSASNPHISESQYLVKLLMRKRRKKKLIL